MPNTDTLQMTHRIGRDDTSSILDYFAADTGYGRTRFETLFYNRASNINTDAIRREFPSCPTRIRELEEPFRNSQNILDRLTYARMIIASTNEGAAREHAELWIDQLGKGNHQRASDIRDYLTAAESQLGQMGYEHIIQMGEVASQMTNVYLDHKWFMFYLDPVVIPYKTTKDETVELPYGPFIVCVKHQIRNRAFHVYPAAGCQAYFSQDRRETYIHPHFRADSYNRTHSVCMGEEQGHIYRSTERKDFPSIVNSFANLIKTYNGGSPYHVPNRYYVGGSTFNKCHSCDAPTTLAYRICDACYANTSADHTVVYYTRRNRNTSGPIPLRYQVEDQRTFRLPYFDTSGKERMAEFGPGTIVAMAARDLEPARFSAFFFSYMHSSMRLDSRGHSYGSFFHFLDQRFPGFSSMSRPSPIDLSEYYDDFDGGDPEEYESYEYITLDGHSYANVLENGDENDDFYTAIHNDAMSMLHRLFPHSLIVEGQSIDSPIKQIRSPNVFTGDTITVDDIAKYLQPYTITEQPNDESNKAFTEAQSAYLLECCLTGILPTQADLFAIGEQPAQPPAGEADSDHQADPVDGEPGGTGPAEDDAEAEALAASVPDPVF